MFATNTNDIVSAISTVGFPIVICLIMCYFIYYLTKTQKETYEKISETIKNNTVAISRLAEKIDNLEK